MYRDVYFLDIPIYRVPQDTYNREFEASKVKKLRAKLSRFSPKPMEELESYQQIENRFEDEFGVHMWRYNQVIGWLRLFAFDRCHIRANYYWVSTKRITKDLKNKRFRNCFEIKTFELDIFPDMSSGEIYALVQHQIKELMEQKPFKKHYICRLTHKLTLTQLWG